MYDGLAKMYRYTAAVYRYKMEMHEATMAFWLTKGTKWLHKGALYHNKATMKLIEAPKWYYKRLAKCNIAAIASAFAVMYRYTAAV